jgi:uncharacterized membrane protein YsdA (DUF1294 family)
MDLPSLTPDAIRTLALQLILWLGSLNAATYALAGIDRDRWAQGRQRMSETALLWLSLIGGWPGLLYGLRASTRLKVRYDYTFRGWLRAAIMTQVLFAAFAIMPQGGLMTATETVASLVMPNAFASERDDRPGRLVMDRDRGAIPVTRVVPLSAEP